MKVSLLKSDAEVSVLFSSSLFFLFGVDKYLFHRIALEEYENLKRLPDPRQIAIQRLQQQQQLNALIAQQQQLAAVQATRVYQQNSQKLGSEIYKSLQTPNGQNMNIARILQYIRDMEIVRKSTNNNVQQAFMNQYTAGNKNNDNYICRASHASIME